MGLKQAQAHPSGALGLDDPSELPQVETGVLCALSWAGPQLGCGRQGPEMAPTVHPSRLPGRALAVS